jgi:hypothetical protein
MVKLTQNVEVAYEVEGTYSDPGGTTLSHLGLLDTFDPRSVEMNITPVPSLGQSTDSHHASGPIGVTVPIKVACQGTGWQQLLGLSIGKTTVYGSVYTPHALTTSANSIALLAREGTDYTLVTGVVPNEVTLTADYSTGGYITCEANCTGFYSQDAVATANFADDGKLLIDDYSAVEFPAAPTDAPLLPTDLTVSYGATTESILNIDGPEGSYIEIGERYMRTYLKTNALDTNVDVGGAVVAAGVLDLTNAAADTVGDLDTLFGTTSGAGKSGWIVDAQSDDSLTTNLLKGIYSTDTQRTIPGINSATAALTAFTNLKTVSLKIANNNTAIAGKVTRGLAAPNDVTAWIQNKAIGRGKSDITLDLSMTAEDETLYDKYVAGTVIPLIRLDFGTSGSIALTNGTITSFSRPLAPGGEIVDTMSIKFRGSGDMRNFSSFAISADWTL